MTFTAEVDDSSRMNDLVCAQCVHFVTFRHAPERGYCKGKIVYSKNRWLHPERNSNDIACPLVVIALDPSQFRALHGVKLLTQANAKSSVRSAQIRAAIEVYL